MARRAVQEGVRSMVATPHVNFEWDYDLAAIGERVGQLNIALARRELPVAVVPGAELAVARLADMADDDLRALCLGGGPYLLVESPYARAVRFLDELLFDLQVRGYRVLLAHPERCPLFQTDVERLRRLVDAGVLCSVNAGSMAGRFGTTVRRFTLELFRAGLVHDVASDAHDTARRPPGMLYGFEAADPDLPGLAAQAAWYTEQAPAAILSGEPLPPRPQPPQPPVSRWRRFVGRA